MCATFGEPPPVFLVVAFHD
jgi:hypothetical protein